LGGQFAGGPGPNGQAPFANGPGLNNGGPFSGGLGPNGPFAGQQGQFGDGRDSNGQSPFISGSGLNNGPPFRGQQGQGPFTGGPGPNGPLGGQGPLLGGQGLNRPIVGQSGPASFTGGPGLNGPFVGQTGQGSPGLNFGQQGTLNGGQPGLNSGIPFNGQQGPDQDEDDSFAEQQDPITGSGQQLLNGGFRPNIGRPILGQTGPIINSPRPLQGSPNLIGQGQIVGRPIAVGSNYAPARLPAPIQAPVYGEPVIGGPAVYNFNYGVKDDYAGVNFGHTENRNGYNTQGNYFVNLPDGRLQTVNYQADEAGYVADVLYTGAVAVPAYAPASPRPAYGPL